METVETAAYREYLSKLPRAERRRILRAHLKRADQQSRLEQRITLKAKQPPIDPADLPYMKEVSNAHS
jgi:hypothetical protein